jgi:hypothetical protein
MSQTTNVFPTDSPVLIIGLFLILARVVLSPIIHNATMIRKRASTLSYTYIVGLVPHFKYNSLLRLSSVNNGFLSLTLLLLSGLTKK